MSKNVILRVDSESLYDIHVERIPFTTIAWNRSLLLNRYVATCNID